MICEGGQSSACIPLLRRISQHERDEKRGGSLFCILLGCKLFVAAQGEVRIRCKLASFSHIRLARVVDCDAQSFGCQLGRIGQLKAHRKGNTKVGGAACKSAACQRRAYPVQSPIG